MAEAYWSYADPRQLNAAAAAGLPVPVAKRPRTDIVADAPGGHDQSTYYTSEDGRVVQRVINDNDSIGASYDNYLRSTQMQVYARNEPAIQQQMQVYARNEPAIQQQMQVYARNEPAIQQQMQVYARNEPARTLDGGLSGGHSVDHLRAVGIGVSDPAQALKSRSMVIGGGGRPELPLPPDASSTLYVEGLPANCTRREVAHIFRPFVGYKEVRLVTKESRHSKGDPLILCFVDFVSPAHAATALDALEGYKFDEHDRDSLRLRLQFARHPGARSGGHRGKR